MNQTVPYQELKYRWERCRGFLSQFAPRAEGMLIFSKLNIYYFTGTIVNGLLWLPLQGEPVLLCRRGLERAKLESPLQNIVPYTSYGDILKILDGLDMPLPNVAAAEMNGLTWALSMSLTKYLPTVQFISGDKILAMTRAKKSPWELKKMRIAGAKHNKCLTELLPPLLHEGLSELAISHKLWEVFFAEGHHGIMHMENYGEEIFLGHVCVGESANYPSVFNGPVGVRGIHPAAPIMGSAQVAWERHQLLVIDVGFAWEGYLTDKTQVYWLGDEKSLPDQARAAHDFCIEIQNEVAAKLKPGAIPSEIWRQVLAKAEQSKWAEGFMGLGRNKVSFVAHGIGLAVDEYPVVAKGFDLPVEEGMVFAIEPKIGLPGLGMVGVENTFEVTPAGGKCLTGEDYRIIAV